MHSQHRLTDMRTSCTLQLDYANLGVEMVWECTGVFLTRAALQPYFEKGIKKVVVSAPVKDADPVLNVVMGCNDVSLSASECAAVEKMPTTWGCHAASDKSHCYAAAIHGRYPWQVDRQLQV